LSSNVHDPALVPSTLRGFRLWQLSSAGLKALVQKSIWPKDDQMVAKCLNSILGSLRINWNGDTVGEHGPEDQIPVHGCTCGIHARYNPSDLEDLIGNTPNAVPGWYGATIMAGVVEASGKIILGTRGFKAEKARIIALAPFLFSDQDTYDSYDTQRRLRHAAAVYSAEYYNDYDYLVNNYPMADLTEFGIAPYQVTTLDMEMRHGRRQRMLSDRQRMNGSHHLDAFRFSYLATVAAMSEKDVKKSVQNLLQAYGS